MKNKNLKAPHDVMFHTPLLFDSCAGAKFPDIVCSEDTCH